MDKSDCQKAAESTYLDYEFDEDAGPSEEAQKGCVVDAEKNAWFNTHATGSQEGAETEFFPICKQGKIHFTAKHLYTVQA